MSVSVFLSVMSLWHGAGGMGEELLTDAVRKEFFAGAPISLKNTESSARAIEKPGTCTPR